MGCPPVRKIIHSLKLVDYLHVQADNPWYNYYVVTKISGGFFPNHKHIVTTNPEKLYKNQNRIVVGVGTRGTSFLFTLIVLLMSQK